MERVSVIIPVHNAEATLEACLKSIFHTAHSNIEVIVVDDASTDGSRRIAETFDCTILESAENRGVATARNTGAELAKGDILYFVDADILQVGDNITAIVECLRSRPDISFLCASLARESTGGGFWERYATLRYYYLTSMFPEDRILKEIPWLASESAAIRRGAFGEVGGFDQRFKDVGCEEHEIGRRIRDRHKIYMHKEIIIQHFRKNFFKFLKSRFARSLQYSSRMPRLGGFDREGSASFGERIDSALSFLGLTTALLLAAGKISFLLPLVIFLLFVLRKRKFILFMMRESGSEALFYTPFIELITGSFIFSGALLGLAKRIQVIFTDKMLNHGNELP
ncbi:glycosyltransferase family 2 protein [Thermodesulfobacteriota bacterium]